MRATTRTFIRGTAALLALVVIAHGGTAAIAQSGSQQESRSVLSSLDSMEAFRAAFNQSTGSTRLVLLLSPT